MVPCWPPAGKTKPIYCPHAVEGIAINPASPRIGSHVALLMIRSIFFAARIKRERYEDARWAPPRGRAHPIAIDIGVARSGDRAATFATIANCYMISVRSPPDFMPSFSASNTYASKPKG